MYLKKVKKKNTKNTVICKISTEVVCPRGSLVVGSFVIYKIPEELKRSTHNF